MPGAGGLPSMKASAEIAKLRAALQSEDSIDLDDIIEAVIALTVQVEAVAALVEAQEVEIQEIKTLVTEIHTTIANARRIYF